MIEESSNLEVVTPQLRRVQAEEAANYVAKTQAMEALSTQTAYVNMDTGEISYGEPPSARAEAVASATATESAVSPNADPLQSTDSEAGFRHARIGVVAVIVIVLFFVWIHQRRAASG